MKAKKVMAMAMASAMILSLTACCWYLHLQYHCLPDVAAEAARMRGE